MTNLENKDVKIRKEHHCFGCARKFERGITLRFVKNVDEGEFMTTYWCKTCTEYWKMHMENGDEINYGDLKSEGRNDWEEIRLSIES